MPYNLPDDWNMYWSTCSLCGERYHMSGTDECACEPCTGTSHFDFRGKACENVKGNCKYHDCADCGQNTDDTREDEEEIYTNYWYCIECRPELFEE